MRLHRTLWDAMTLLIACVGVGVVMFTGQLVGVAIAAALVVSVVGCAIASAREMTVDRSLVARFAATVLVGTLGIVSAVGAWRIIGPVTLLVVALLALSNPTLVLWCRTRLRSRPAPDETAFDEIVERVESSEPRPVSVEPVPTRESLTDMSDAALCRRWRVTYRMVDRAQSPAQLAHLADLRRALLDELAERHPADVARWLREGARAASDPGRYVRPEPGSDDIGGGIARAC